MPEHLPSLELLATFATLTGLAGFLYGCRLFRHVGVLRDLMRGFAIAFTFVTLLEALAMLGLLGDARVFYTVRRLAFRLSLSVAIWAVLLKFVLKRSPYIG